MILFLAGNDGPPLQSFAIKEDKITALKRDFEIGVFVPRLYNYVAHQRVIDLNIRNKRKVDQIMDLFLAGDTSGFDIIKPQYLIAMFNILLSYEHPKGKDSVDQVKRTLDLFLAGADKFGKQEVKNILDLYLVGPEKQIILEEVFKQAANMLFNYIDGKRAVDVYKEMIKPGKLFVDSGAFSAWTKGKVIDVDEYINWLNDRADSLYLFGQLDVIPGDRIHGATLQQVREAAQKTWENYLYMRSRLKNKDGLLYTFHVGEPYEFLENALEWTDENNEHIKYIALGGMVGKPKQVRERFLENCFEVIKKSNNPNVKVHAFGMTDFELLSKFPITSADSTSWIMTGAIGSIMTDYGVICVSSKQKSDPKHYSHLSPEQIQNFNNMIKRFGFTLEELAEDRDKRILFNAQYMLEKASKINNNHSVITKRKKLF